jgi:hypothetical protein|tara:strand:+ start:126 stop:245 length:120 start_codon:yes stop_codon:yes gene_type:complete
MSDPHITKEEIEDDMGDKLVVTTYDDGEVIMVPLEETEN